MIPSAASPLAPPPHPPSRPHTGPPPPLCTALRCAHGRRGARGRASRYVSHLPCIPPICHTSHVSAHLSHAIPPPPMCHAPAVLLPSIGERTPGCLPNANEHIALIDTMSKDKMLAFFLDYDGTLTPIVENPSDAKLTEEVESVSHNPFAPCAAPPFFVNITARVIFLGARRRARPREQIPNRHRQRAGACNRPRARTARRAVLCGLPRLRHLWAAQTRPRQRLSRAVDPLSGRRLLPAGARGGQAQG